MPTACPLLAVCALLAGCVVSDDDVDFDQATSEVVSNNKIATNGLHANKPYANRLGTNSLLNAALTAPQLLDTTDGRELLSYIVSCALEPNTQLILQRNGLRHTFSGGLGLAPQWRFHVPTQTERRWVTACVLARTNLYGTTVDLSLRGPHSKLGAARLEPAQYALVEGAFFGDLFAPSGPQMFACDAVVRDLDLALSTQELRACVMSDDGKTTRCGFTYAGKCALLDLGLQPACGSLVAPYKKCRGGQDRFEEVITVYLKTGR